MTNNQQQYIGLFYVLASVGAQSVSAATLARTHTQPIRALEYLVRRMSSGYIEYHEEHFEGMFGEDK